ncbi:hypothetical protein ABIF14_009498 [Bradyrhizobium elkanii]
MPTDAPVSCGHGYGPARTIVTGGPVEVARAKSRDRGAVSDGERIRFSSAILPLWAGRTRSLDAVAGAVSAPHLDRRFPGGANGLAGQGRAERRKAKKELIGFQVGVRESAQSWRELLIDVKQRGLKIATEIAVGDGALGFWKALDEVFPGTRHQRCWMHKTVNVLDKIPLSVQATMKMDLREVLGAEPGVRRSGDRRLRREIPRQIRSGGRMSGQGSRRPAGLLRLSCRALGSLAHDG